MRRDRRLQGLSSEHHQALVLARKINRACASGEVGAELRTEIRQQFAQDLQPHFDIEEQTLLPALRALGTSKAQDLAQRTESDHQRLKEFLEQALSGENTALEEFGRVLEAHVRFEERVLFPACEQLLAESVLDEVERRCPKTG